MRQVATGVPISLAVTALDGLVVARSAFESSIHYRSAILFGSCTDLRDEEKLTALDVLTDALLPGRVAEVRRPHLREIAATFVLALAIREWSLKVSAGWPEDEEADVAGDAWAGVVPVITGYGWPEPAPDLRAGITAPASVRALPAPAGRG
jgi:nitroimidazol reductase NimA-like FMN-containing flavoprotein (pyridoxamine 5'-phosphate oxidase superfamily)